MSYRREMNNALKIYFKPFGFKYSTKCCMFEYPENVDLMHCISVSDETRFRPQYFWLRIFVYVQSRFMTSLISELTGRECAYRGILSFETVPGREDPHVEFIGERPMEENIADFSNHMDKYVFPIFEQFKDTQSVINYFLYEKWNNKDVRHWTGASYIDHYTYPLAYYLAGQNDRCLQQLQKNREHLEWQASHPGSMAIDELNYFRPFQANLTKWINDGKVIRI